MFDADYWVANLRNPVRFSQAVARPWRNMGATFIEVSPHPLLTPRHHRHAWSRSGRAAASRSRRTLTRDNPETLTFHTQLATVRPPSIAAAGNCQWHREARRHAADAWQHVALLGGAARRRPAGGQRPPAAGHARRTAVRPRPCVAGRRRTRARSLAGRPQGARPTGHARHRVSPRSPWPPPAKRSACRRQPVSTSASRSSRCFR